MSDTTERRESHLHVNFASHTILSHILHPIPSLCISFSLQEVSSLCHSLLFSSFQSLSLILKEKTLEEKKQLTNHENAKELFKDIISVINIKYQAIQGACVKY